MFTLAVHCSNGIFVFQGEITVKQLTTDKDRIVIKSPTVERTFKGSDLHVAIINDKITKAFSENRTTVAVDLKTLQCLITSYKD